MSNLRIQSLAAQVDILEPVVEAALAYVDERRKLGLGIGSPAERKAETALLEAVREYEEALREDDE